MKVLKSLLDDLKIKKHSALFWNWHPSTMNSFVAYDGKGADLFKFGNSLEPLLLLGIYYLNIELFNS